MNADNLRMALLATVTTAVALSGAAQVPTTLRELAVSALQTNESIGRAESDVRRAEATTRLARSALLPRLDLSGTSTWYEDEATLDLSPTESFVIRPRNDWSWNADLSQTLFYGLRDWRGRDWARLQLDIARLDRHTTANNLVLAVAGAFLQATSDAQRVDVARTTLEQTTSQLKVAERRHEVGETAFADVARWRSEKAGAYQRVVVAEGDAELSLRRLVRLTMFPDILELEDLGLIPAPEGSDDQLVTLALEQRLEMLALRNQLEAAGLMVKIEKGAWLPELEAHVQYFQQKAEFPSQDWTSVALTAKVPVFDGGFTAARVAEAREDERQVELLELEVTKRIGDEVEASAIGHRAAAAAFDAARERVVAAREAHRQVERAYRVGESSATDLLAATAELTDAETTQIIARAQREYQAIALRHAVGDTPLPDLDPLSVLDETKDDSEE